MVTSASPYATNVSCRGERAGKRSISLWWGCRHSTRQRVSIPEDFGEGHGSSRKPSEDSPPAGCKYEESSLTGRFFLKYWFSLNDKSHFNKAGNVVPPKKDITFAL